MKAEKRTANNPADNLPRCIMMVALEATNATKENTRQNTRKDLDGGEISTDGNSAKI